MMPANKSKGTDRSASELLRGLSLAAFRVVLHSSLAFERGLLVVPTLVMAETYQGFGVSTLGGTGQPIYSVTNLNDAGPGSLRDAVSQGKRYITFKTAGEIKLTSDMYV